MAQDQKRKKNTYRHSEDRSLVRPMPQATDVEQAVLGALMIDRDAYDRVKHYLSKETFYEPRNQLVFEAIKYLAEKEKAVDVLTVTERLKDENNLEEVGGAAYVAELSSKVATSANIEDHSEIIVKRQLQRFAIKVAQATEDKAHDNTLVIEEELANFQTSMEKLVDVANGRFEDDYTPLTLAQVIEEERTEPDGLETQYYVKDRDNNYYNVEIPAKQLTLIGAQTSHGKSRLLENLAIHFVEHSKNDEVVLYYTFEESRNMVFEEMLSLFTSNVPLSMGRNIDTIRKYYKGNRNYINSKADLNEFNKKADLFDKYQQKHLRIINKPYSVEEIIDNIKFLSGKFAAEGKTIKAVFIDYVQLIRRLEETGNVKADICYVMRKLQDFAVMKAKLPIILAAQLNRSAGSPLDLHNQNMADASDIEHNAGMVILEWNSSFRPITGSSWDKPENKSERERLSKLGLEPGKPGKMYILVTKWRGGPRGTEAVLTFNQNTGLIEGNDKEVPAEAKQNIVSDEEKDAPF